MLALQKELTLGRCGREFRKGCIFDYRGRRGPWALRILLRNAPFIGTEPAYRLIQLDFSSNLEWGDDKPRWLGLGFRV